MIGFDGVESHAAHGYLLDQFFWPGTNKREDQWGGSLRNRARLAADVIAEIRRMAGMDFVISLRISQWKVQDFKAKNFNTPAELEEFSRIMVDAGVDVFHCSTRRFWDNEFESDRNLAAWTKKLSGKPTIAVGSIGMTGEHIDTLMAKAATSPRSIICLSWLTAVTSTSSPLVGGCWSTRIGPTRSVKDASTS